MGFCALKPHGVIGGAVLVQRHVSWCSRPACAELCPLLGLVRTGGMQERATISTPVHLMRVSDELVTGLCAWTLGVGHLEMCRGGRAQLWTEVFRGSFLEEKTSELVLRVRHNYMHRRVRSM